MRLRLPLLAALAHTTAVVIAGRRAATDRARGRTSGLSLRQGLGRSLAVDLGLNRRIDNGRRRDRNGRVIDHVQRRAP